MIDHESRIGEAFEKAVRSAQWLERAEIIGVCVCVVYLAARVIPWALAGFPVVSK